MTRSSRKDVDQWYHCERLQQQRLASAAWPTRYRLEHRQRQSQRARESSLRELRAERPVFDASMPRVGDNASWFFHAYARRADRGTTSAVTHQEFKFALDHPAVDCPGEELVETSASVEPLQPSCENAGEIGLLLGNEDAVDYSIEGDIAPGSTVSVTASAKAGFELMGDDEWEITFDSFDPSSCEEDPDDPTPDPTSTPLIRDRARSACSAVACRALELRHVRSRRSPPPTRPTGGTLPFTL